MNCCNDFGQCTNGHNCAARGPYKTVRERVEAEHFGIKPAKVGKRYQAAMPLLPLAWRTRTLKTWAALVMGGVLGSLFSIVVIILWKVWV